MGVTYVRTFVEWISLGYSSKMQLCTSYWKKLIELSPPYIRPFQQNHFAKSLQPIFVAVNQTNSFMSRSLSAYHSGMLHMALCCRSITFDCIQCGDITAIVRESLICINFLVGCSHGTENTATVCRWLLPLHPYVNSSKLKIVKRSKCFARSVQHRNRYDRKGKPLAIDMRLSSVTERSCADIRDLFLPFLASCRRVSLMNAAYN